MTHSDIFTMRISPEDRRRLAELAESVDRSESAVVRFLIRSTMPTAFGGLMPLNPSEQRMSAPEALQAA
jgi:hypothetical protein